MLEISLIICQPAECRFNANTRPLFELLVTDVISANENFVLEGTVFSNGAADDPSTGFRQSFLARFTPIVGDIGTFRIEGTATSAEAVPEPSTILGTVAAAGMGYVTRRRQLAQQQEDA